jgi:lysophospholipase L1-like esterase
MITALLLAALALAEPAGPPTPPPDMTPRNAAKWLMLHGDIAELGVHAEANRTLIASGDRRPRVVLLGDSITFHWPAESLPELDAVRMVNRGIPGQNTSQMLLRFEDDVVALAPAAVVILAGTNDLRIFSRPASGEAARRQIARNITAMTDIAEARRIRVVLCAIPPVGASEAGRTRDPSAIVAANQWLRSFAAARGYGFVDYHRALVGPDGLIAPEHTSDGLHLTPAAYGKLEALLREALQTLVKR